MTAKNRKKSSPYRYFFAALGVTFALGLLAIIAFLLLWSLQPVPAPALSASSTPATALKATSTLFGLITPTDLPTATPANTPTNTNTPKPLSASDLEPFLILPGDLPAGYYGAQVRPVLPSMFRELPPAASVIYQEIATIQGQKGGVAVALYDSPSTLDEAYRIILDSMSDQVQPLPSVGERAHYLAVYFVVTGDMITEALFMRCGAVVHIRITGLSQHSGADQIVTYAGRLDARLAQILCK